MSCNEFGHAEDGGNRAGTALGIVRQVKGTMAWFGKRASASEGALGMDRAIPNNEFNELNGLRATVQP